MARRRHPYHQILHIRLVLLFPGWKLFCRIFPASTLSGRSGKFFELLVRPFRIIVLVMWVSSINYSLTAWAGVILLSRIFHRHHWWGTSASPHALNLHNPKRRDVWEAGLRCAINHWGLQEAVAEVGGGVGAFTSFISARYPRPNLYEYLQVGERQWFNVRHI